MFRVLTVFLIMQNYCFGVEIYSKCCDSESVFKQNNSMYNCTKNVDKRIEFLTNNTNFIDNSTEGYCIEAINNTVGLFFLNETFLYKERDIQVDFFPKCCPLNYFYNVTSHGCVKSETELPRFFKKKIIKVGLPHCKLIMDIKSTFRNYFEQLNNGSLYLLKHNQIYDNYCVDKNENNEFVARICTDDYDICDKIKCVHKCCHDGQSFVNGPYCQNTYIHGLDFSSLSKNVENGNDSFAIIHGYTRPIYILHPTRFNFHLEADGVFAMKEQDESSGKMNVTKRYNAKDQVYCIEHTFKQKPYMNGYFFFREYRNDTEINPKFLYTRAAMAISCVFLVLTILYYCVSNEKRTLFGKTLISYCFGSLLAFLLLTYLAFDLKRGLESCNVFAFLVSYSTLSSFTWMNVMCIDIYCTFGSSKSFSSRQHGSKELKRFMWYSLHGWGSPLVLTAIPLIFYKVKVLPFGLQVTIPISRCLVFLGNANYALFLFSTIPLSIIECCNFILFIKTTIYCFKIKNEISKMNDTQALKGENKQKFNKFQDRFGLLIKLFLIMGISWLFEVVSAFVGFKTNGTTAVIEIVWDTFNSLQGFFIFIIFIVKKRIYRRFEQKIGLAKLRKFSLSSSAATQTTSLQTICSSNKH